MPNAVQQCLAANNILLMRKGNRAFLLLAITPAWSLGDLMIKQLLNSIIVKYRDLSVSRRSIICRSLQLRQIIDLLATEKSRHFAQPRRKKLLIIIRGKIFFLFIGRKPITWPTNNCLQIMVYSCTMSSNCVWLSVWLQIIFCCCVKMADRFVSRRD